MQETQPWDFTGLRLLNGLMRLLRNIVSRGAGFAY